MRVASDGNLNIWTTFGHEKESDLVILLEVEKGL